MAKEVITVGGEEKVVREDTAKSYRGIIWALVSVAIFIAIAAVLVMVFFGGSISRGVDSPAEIEKQAGR
jgi:flagellar basal body-associated protein FliL